MENQWKFDGKTMENQWKISGKSMENRWKIHGKSTENRQKIDRKSAENREAVQFELASVFDLAGIRAPNRQCTRTEFPSIGTAIG